MGLSELKTCCASDIIGQLLHFDAETAVQLAYKLIEKFSLHVLAPFPSRGLHTARVLQQSIHPLGLLARAFSGIQPFDAPSRLY